MKLKMRIKNRTYTFLYKFNGGEYYTPNNAIPGQPWIALMEDGSLQTLFNGFHYPYEAEYELYEE